MEALIQMIRIHLYPFQSDRRSIHFGTAMILISMPVSPTGC